MFSGVLIALSLVSLLALATATVLAIAIRRGLRAKHWPRHVAKVVHSELTRKWSRYGEFYYVRVSYRSLVGSGREISCVLPSFLGTDRKDYAVRLASFFHDGASVPVYVDPDHLDRSTLLPGVDGREWLVFFLMALVAVGAPMIAIYLP